MDHQRTRLPAPFNGRVCLRRFVGRMQREDARREEAARRRREALEAYRRMPEPQRSAERWGRRNPAATDFLRREIQTRGSREAAEGQPGGSREAAERQPGGSRGTAERQPRDSRERAERARM